jgi:hypothetical protein
MTVKEFHKMENSKTQQAVEGWITEPLVAQHEGIINYSTNETQRALLDDILAGLPSRPHERPDLAAKGSKQYEYSSKLLNIHKQDMKQGMEVQAECHVKDKGDFEAMVQQMGNPGNFTKGPTRKVTHASSSGKALTDEEQTKVNFMKEVKSLTNKIVADMKVFQQLHFKGKTMVVDKTSGVTNELLHALNQANQELRKWEHVMMEVHFTANQCDPMNFKIKQFEGNMGKAKEAYESVQELKHKATRIIGK